MTLTESQRNDLRLLTDLTDEQAAAAINSANGWRKISPAEIELWLPEAGAGELLETWREENRLSLADAQKPENEPLVQILEFVRALLGLRQVNVDLAPGTKYRAAVDNAEVFELPVTPDVIESLLDLARVPGYVDVTAADVFKARLLIQSEDALEDHIHAIRDAAAPSLSKALVDIQDGHRETAWSINEVEKS